MQNTLTNRQHENNQDSVALLLLIADNTKNNQDSIAQLVLSQQYRSIINSITQELNTLVLTVIAKQADVIRKRENNVLEMSN